MVGVTPDGTVHTNSGPGLPWTERGSLGGPPEALTVSSARRIHAAVGGKVLVSDDGGDTFAVLFSR